MTNLNARPRVQLELTPVWWRLLTSRLAIFGPHNEAVRELHTRCVAYALSLQPVSVHTDTDAFSVIIEPPQSVAIATLCEKAERVIAHLNGLDIECLKEG